MVDIVRLADHHRTGAFSSGTPPLDHFLCNEAYNENGDYGTTWVVVPAVNSPDVIAFYTLSYPYELGPGDDQALARPAIELSWLAVDKQHQGMGIGTKILRGLIDRILDSLDDYPVDLLLLVAISPKVRGWYLSRNLGFLTAESPEDHLTQYLLVRDMRELRNTDSQWHEKRYELPPFPWPREC